MKRFFLLNRIEAIKYYNTFTVVALVVYFLYAAGFSSVKLQHQQEALANFSVFEEVVKRYFRTIVFSILPLTLIISLSREFSIQYVSKLLCNGYTRNGYIQSKYLLILQLSILATLLFGALVTVCFYFTETHFQIAPSALLQQGTAVFFSAGYMLLLGMVCTLVFKNIRDSIALFLFLQLLELSLAEIFRNDRFVNFMPVSSVTSFFDKALFSLPEMVCIVVYAALFLYLNHVLFRKAEL